MGNEWKMGTYTHSLSEALHLQIHQMEDINRLF